MNKKFTRIIQSMVLIMFFIMLTENLQAQYMQGKDYSPPVISDNQQDRNDMVRGAIRIGQLLAGVGLLLRLVVVIKKVNDQGGQAGMGEVTNWFVLVFIYIILFEVVIQMWLLPFIGM